MIEGMAAPPPSLLHDERILWEGEPPSGLMLLPRDALLIPFSLLWGGFALFWNGTVWMMPATDWFFRLWGLPFLLAGAYVTFGRFLVDVWIRRRLRYFVTDQRILIHRTAPAASLRTLDIRRLPLIETVERPDGSGTIVFGEQQSPFGWRGRSNWHASIGLWQPALDPTPQFLRIPDVSAIRALIERTARMTD